MEEITRDGERSDIRFKLLAEEQLNSLLILIMILLTSVPELKAQKFSTLQNYKILLINVIFQAFAVLFKWWHLFTEHAQLFKKGC